MKFYALALGVVCSVATPASAQEAAAPQAVLIAPVAAGVLRAGADIPLLMREELTTKKKKLRVGQRFQMEVASSVMMNGVVVIPGGTPALGEVTEVRNKGMWGKSGYIGARVVSLRLGDRHVRLNGSFDDKGVTGTGGVVAAALLVPVVGFFTTGTSAYIPMGSSIKAFLDEDLAFAMPEAAPVASSAVIAPVAAVAVVKDDGSAPVIVNH